MVKGRTESNGSIEPVLRYSILAGCYLLALLPRLFSVVRFESMIHEYDPYFNYRSTKYLIENGFTSFNDWFDEKSWYPLGRSIGQTVYPGLMTTTASIYWVLNWLGANVSVKDICVFLPPFMAANTSIVTYMLGMEVSGGSRQVGLLAAFFMAIVPGYTSRSVAGTFDNEAIAIFAMLSTFLLFLRSVRTGRLLDCTYASIAYMYMASSWGGYVYVINIIPLYVVLAVLCGMYSLRLWVAYSIFYVMGSILSIQVPLIGFQAVSSSEHLFAMATFFGLQLYAISTWSRRSLPSDSGMHSTLTRSLVAAFAAVVASATIICVATGRYPSFTGRFWSLIDPTYAARNIPLIASVAEHAPTTWSNFFFDLHFLAFLLPLGLYRTCKEPTEANIFVLLFTTSCVYFSGVMIRLLLLLAPAACLLSAIGLSPTITTYMQHIRSGTGHSSSRKKSDIASKLEVAVLITATIAVFLVLYVLHCTWVTSEAYSSPSIVLQAKGPAGDRMMFDDFREAYAWIRHNTAEDAKIMSWWDYGYQIGEMAKRATVIDNNTWNNTHIASVALAFSAPEGVSARVMSVLGVDYVMVVFGGMTGYSSDDINKLLWITRISSEHYDGSKPLSGGPNPVIQEANYLSPRTGAFTIGKDMGSKLSESLLYKLCYYRFGEVSSEYGKPMGYDRARGTMIGDKDIHLESVEEAFTSSHWLVRVYKVKKEMNNRK